MPSALTRPASNYSAGNPPDLRTKVGIALTL